MNNYFTEADTRVVNDVLEKYREIWNDENFGKGEPKDEGEHEKKLAFMNDTKEFLGEALNAVLFTFWSTKEKTETTDNGIVLTCTSLFEDADQFIETASTLTLGFSDDFADWLKVGAKDYNRKNFYIKLFQRAEYSEDDLIFYETKTIVNAFKGAMHDDSYKNITVGEMMKAINLTHTLREKYSIKDETMENDCLELYFSQKEKGTENVLFKKVIKQ